MLGSDVELHRADVRDPASLQGAGDGIDVVVHTVGARSYFGGNGGAAVDGDGVRNLMTALVASSSRPRIVLLSAFGLGRKSWALDVFSKVLGDYFTHKASAEATVQGSGLPWTIVRPVELRNRPPRSGPLLNQSKPLSLTRTVSRELVADVLLACALRPDLAGVSFEVCEGGVTPLESQFDGLQPDGQWAAPTRTPMF